METNINNIIQNKYTVISKIGNGKFGTVYLGKTNKENVAIKFDNSSIGILKHEVSILYYLNEKKSLGIPRIIWYGISKTENPITDSSGEYILGITSPSIHIPCFIMPYYDCTLKEYISSQSTFTYTMLNKMLSILKNIHELFVIHRDLKPDNFMIKNGEIFLIDFGLATFYIDGKTGIHFECNKNRTEIVGSLLYASYNSHLGYTHSRRDDCIQLGYIFLYIILGYLPWECIRMTGIPHFHSNLVQTNINHPYNQERCKRKEITSILDIPELYSKDNNIIISYISICYTLNYEDIPIYICNKKNKE